MYEAFSYEFTFALVDAVFEFDLADDHVILIVPRLVAALVLRDADVDAGDLHVGWIVNFAIPSAPAIADIVDVQSDVRQLYFSTTCSFEAPKKVVINYAIRCDLNLLIAII